MKIYLRFHGQSSEMTATFTTVFKNSQKTTKLADIVLHLQIQQPILFNTL